MFTTITYLYVIAASVRSVLLLQLVRFYWLIISTFDSLRRSCNRCFRWNVMWLHAFTKWLRRAATLCHKASASNVLLLEPIDVVRDDTEPKDPLPAADQIDLVVQ